MDSISSLFRINLMTVVSRAPLDPILKNYDLINDFQVTFRDLSTNQAHQINQVRLRINSLDDVQSRPEPVEVLKQLHSVVLEESKKYETSSIIELIDTPWYERWKDAFLHHHYLYSHDFIGANFGVIVIISVADLNTYDNEVSRLLASVRESVHPKMMTSYIEHFVVVDDVTELPANSSETEIEIPQAYRKPYERFVNCFGTERCSWLPLPPGQSLHHYVVRFFQNYITRSLIPWCEHQVRFLNDAISARKGLGLNLFNATRQLLNIGTSSYANQSVVYTPDAVELQCRKLGDIAMSLGLYDLAATNYERARREFLKDGAWFHYSGSCEAYAAAQFMQNKFHKGSRDYIEKAVATYQDTCRSTDLATRATILATDILRKSSPVDAAKFFISLTGDDSDLRSALFLEQASRCFALCTTRNRKAAFHYVLAGYRYTRCGLRALSLRCYSEFKAYDWTAAANHVGASIDRIHKQMSESGEGALDTLPEIALKHSTRSTLEFDVKLVSPLLVDHDDGNLVLKEREFYAGEMIKICISSSSQLPQQNLSNTTIGPNTQDQKPKTMEQSNEQNFANIDQVSGQLDQALTLDSQQQWANTNVSLYSNAGIWSENGYSCLLNGESKCISLSNPRDNNYYQIRMPRVACKHVIYFKFDYVDSQDTLRQSVKTFSLTVKPSLQLLTLIGPVISIKNVINDKILTTGLICQNNQKLNELWHNSDLTLKTVVSDNGEDQSFTDIAPNMVAHLLAKQNHASCSVPTVNKGSSMLLNNSCPGDEYLTVRWRLDELLANSKVVVSRHGVLVLD